MRKEKITYNVYSIGKWEDPDAYCIRKWNGKEFYCHCKELNVTPSKPWIM